MGRLGRKKRRVRGVNGKGDERKEAFSLFPSSPARFLFFRLFISIFIGIPSGSLCARRRGEVTEEDSTGASGVFKTYMPCLVYGQNFSRHHESEPPERYDVFLCTVCNCIAWNTPSRKYMMEEPHILISLTT